MQTSQLSLPPADGSVQPCSTCEGHGVDEHEIRCRDCFGSGNLGDGLLQSLASRERAVEVPCPTCSAAVGLDCAPGFREPDQVQLLDAESIEPIEGVHTRRVRVAVATLPQRPERLAA